MTIKEFEELIGEDPEGEDPEDVLGGDWENIVEELSEV